jgi:GAF domain-containing protein
MSELDHARHHQFELDARKFDAFAETAFEDLIHAVADILDAPITAVRIVDGTWPWFNTTRRLTQACTSCAAEFYDTAICSPEAVFVVEDATKDPRFAHHRLVTGEPHIRFYAAAALELPSGRGIGTLEAVDSQTCTIDPEKIEHLKFMANQILATLAARSVGIISP